MRGGVASIPLPAVGGGGVLEAPEVWVLAAAACSCSVVLLW